MKITFNPAIKNYQINYKPLKTNATHLQNGVSLNSLNWVADTLTFGKREVYVIDYDGSYEKHESAKAVKRKLNVTNVDSILHGKNSASGNKTYIYADELEYQNGNINFQVLNKTLLSFRDANSQPIYAIDYFGNIQRFDNITQASIELKIDKAHISLFLTQSRETAREHIFIKAFDVELRDKSGKLLKDENGNPILDIATINKEREKFLYRNRKFPVARIAKDGTVKTYANMEQASTDMNCKKAHIDASYRNQGITHGSYTFVRLSDVVLLNEFGDVVFDENNDFVIDYNKVKELTQNIFAK